MLKETGWSLQVGWLDGLFFGLAACLIGMVLALLLFQLRQRRRGQRHHNMGLKQERKARKLLKKFGFKLMEVQPQFESQLMVNDEKMSFMVTPDFLVSLQGVHYVVEVKSGRPKWSSHARTRRQVLEYLVASGMPCLLLNMEDRDFEVIERPSDGL